MRIPLPEAVNDLAVRLIGAFNPKFLTRDTLKMCLRPGDGTLDIRCGPEFEVGEVVGQSPPDDWMDTLNSAGMRVTARTWTAEVVTRDLAFVPVVRAENRIVATALVRPVADCPNAAVIQWVGVRPEYRGHRLGRIITASGVNGAVRRGATEVFLAVEDHRLAAVRTYLALGFKPCLSSWDRTQRVRWARVLGKLHTAVAFCRNPAHRRVIALLNT